MEHQQTRFIAEKRFSLFRLLFLAAVAILMLAPGTAGAQKSKAGHQKLSADLANFPLNADGTVNVIIQFKQTPKAHFSEMAAGGGKLKLSFDRINGAAYRIPVSMLAWLQNHPDVVYVSPDRPN
jgi:hypothetical protein